MGELRLRLKAAFDAEDIEIPWPHTRVFFGNDLALGNNTEPEEKIRAEKTAVPQKQGKASKHSDVLPPDDN